MINVVTFKWQSAYKIVYTAHHVNVLRDMVQRHLSGEVRFICVTDDPEGVDGETFPLWSDCAELINASGTALPSCYRRLKLFDPETQRAMGIGAGERIVNLDLDTVIFDALDPLFERDEDFVGWAVRGTHHARVFNGSMWLLSAGAHADVWRDFDPDSSPRLAKEAKYLGSDQSWMSLKLRGAAGWGEADGVFSFPLRLKNLNAVPDDVRVAMFHGFQKPWMRGMPAWVDQHWRITGRGRCLVLGYGETLWSDVETALADGPFDGIIASPEAAEHWPGEITAIGRSDDECERLALSHGFDDFVFCGRNIEQLAA